MRMSDIAGAVLEPFWSDPEPAGPRERAQRYLRPGGAGGRPRHRVPRRGSLRLPPSRPRPAVTV
jgi:hypothetical protein